MLDFSKFDKLYELFTDNTRITTAVLLENGFSKYDLSVLVKKGFLNRIETGIYGINLEQKSVCLNMFSRRVKAKNLEGMLECFKVLDSKYYNEIDCASLLILMSYLYDLPKKYKNRVKYPSERNFDNGYPACRKFKTSIQKLYFYAALESMDEAVRKGDERDIFANLLWMCKDKYWETKYRIDRLVEAKKYQELDKLYDQLFSYRKLSYEEKLSKMLAHDINYRGFLTEKEGPCREGNLADLIQLRRYLVAMDKVKKDGTLYKLLRELMIKDGLHKITVNEIVESFSNDSSDEIIRKTELYLNRIGCSNYFEYIRALINLGDLEQDRVHKMALEDLDKISKREFVFDVTEYVQDFYIALYNKEIAKAGIYLDIVSHSKEFKGPDIDVTKMYEEYLKEKEIEEDVKTTISDEYIDEVIKDVKSEKGLRVVYGVDEIEKSKIRKKVVESTPTILVESVGEGVVLRYKNPDPQYIDYGILDREGRKALEVGNYSKAKECFDTICTNVMTIWPATYKKMGLACLGNAKSEEDYRRAYDYLWIAKEKGEKVEELPEVAKKITGNKTKVYVKEQQKN